MSSTASQRRVGQRGEGAPTGGPARPARRRCHGSQRDHRDDLLGQHVERVARVADRLDRAGLHPLGDHGGLDQVAAVLGEQHAAADRADLVAGPADALQPAGDASAATRPGRRGRPRPCRCRARGCEVATTAGSRPAFSSSSTIARCSRDTEPWCAAATGWTPLGHAAAGAGLGHQRGGVRARRHRLAGGPLVGQLVEPGWSAARPAGGSWRTRSSSGAPRQVEHPLLDVPARSTSAAGRRPPSPSSSPVGCAELAHVLDRDDDREVRLSCCDGGATTVDRRGRRPRKRATSSTGRTVADRPIRCAGRSSSASSRSRRERQVGAALGAGDRVHLVDDHRLDAAQRLAGRRW